MWINLVLVRVQLTNDYGTCVDNNRTSEHALSGGDRLQNGLGLGQRQKATRDVEEENVARLGGCVQIRTKEIERGLETQTVIGVF